MDGQATCISITGYENDGKHSKKGEKKHRNNSKHVQNQALVPDVGMVKQYEDKKHEKHEKDSDEEDTLWCR